MSTMESDISISNAFVTARQSGVRMDNYPGDMPADLVSAYRIQDNAIALHGHKVGGWKVGRIPDNLVPVFGAERLAGPIFANQIVLANEDAPINMPVLPGFAAAEAELMLRIGHVPDADLNVETARDIIDQVRFGIEIASSPFSGINANGPAVTISDFGNNHGLVLGPEIENWREMDLLEQNVVLNIDYKKIGENKLANMLDGPFGSVAFVSNLLRGRGLQLNAGDWISTGAITGVHEILIGQKASASFAGRYHVECTATGFAG